MKHQRFEIDLYGHESVTVDMVQLAILRAFHQSMVDVREMEDFYVIGQEAIQGPQVIRT